MRAWYLGPVENMARRLQKRLHRGLFEIGFLRKEFRRLPKVSWSAVEKGAFDWGEASLFLRAA